MCIWAFGTTIEVSVDECWEDYKNRMEKEKHDNATGYENEIEFDDIECVNGEFEDLFEHTVLHKRSFERFEVSVSSFKF